MQGKRTDTRRLRADGKVLGGHHRERNEQVLTKPGRLTQALERMRQAGFGVESLDIVLAIRCGDLSLADGSHFREHRALLLQALHRRGPFAPERDFRRPRGVVRPAVC